MRKKSLILTSVLLFVLVMVTLAGCGTKYCSVNGCPKESARGANYCYEHKCSNFNCTNQAIESYSFCEKCLTRAINK